MRWKKDCFAQSFLCTFGDNYDRMVFNDEAEESWRMKKSISNIKKICAALAGAAVVFCCISIAVAKFITHIRKQTLEEALAWQKEHYDTSWFDALSREIYTVQSYDGYVLHAELVRNPEETDRYVILSHGYTDNRYGNLKYMRDYLRNGYNCITYDLRGHGENENTFCTYGKRESKDLACLIDDSFRRYGDGIELGLHGESLGAATTAAVLGLRQNVAFAVCDCGFADIMNVLQGASRKRGLPAWILQPASAASKLVNGYAFTEMRPIDALSDNHVPMMFIHGSEDTFILPDNSLRMNNATAGYSEYHLIQGAYHAQSVLTDPEQYGRLIDRFLSGIHKEEKDSKAAVTADDTAAEDG